MTDEEKANEKEHDNAKDSHVPLLLCHTITTTHKHDRENIIIKFNIIIIMMIMVTMTLDRNCIGDSSSGRRLAGGWREAEFQSLKYMR